MSLTDLDLTLTPTGYDLSGTTTSELQRMRDRWVVQFTSQRARGRGCIFASEVAAGRVRTNADVITVFAVASTQVIQDMRQFAQDLFPYRAELLEFEFIAARIIRLRFTVFTNLGNIILNLVVE